MNDPLADKHANALINAGIVFVLILAFGLAGMALSPSKPQGMTVIATVKK